MSWTLSATKSRPSYYKITFHPPHFSNGWLQTLIQHSLGLRLGCRLWIYFILLYSSPPLGPLSAGAVAIKLTKLWRLFHDRIFSGIFFKLFHHWGVINLSFSTIKNGDGFGSTIGQNVWQWTSLKACLLDQRWLHYNRLLFYCDLRPPVIDFLAKITTRCWACTTSTRYLNRECFFLRTKKKKKHKYELPILVTLLLLVRRLSHLTRQYQQQ